MERDMDFQTVFVVKYFLTVIALVTGSCPFLFILTMSAAHVIPQSFFVSKAVTAILYPVLALKAAYLDNTRNHTENNFLECFLGNGLVVDLGYRLEDKNRKYDEPNKKKLLGMPIKLPLPKKSNFLE